MAVDWPKQLAPETLLFHTFWAKAVTSDGSSLRLWSLQLASCIQDLLKRS